VGNGEWWVGSGEWGMGSEEERPPTAFGGVYDSGPNVAALSKLQST